MPPRSNKSRRQQTITYNLSSANARDAFEEELEIEDAELQSRHIGGRAKVTVRGSSAFSLAADMPLPLHQRDLSGMHEYSSPQATADIINLLELFGASLDREVVENVYIGCNSSFEIAMERLLELAANSACSETATGASGQGGAAEATAAAGSACESSAPTGDAAGSCGVCRWEQLPDDLKRHVFASLNSRDLARVARTCRDFAGPARSMRTNTRQLQIPTGLGVQGIMSMVAGHPNARSVSLRQWSGCPLSDADFTALVVALSAGSRSERRATPVEALSFKGCRWMSDGHVMALCHTMQHLKEVDLTDCVGITDAALLALSKYQRMAPEGSSSSDDEGDGGYYDGGAATPLAAVQQRSCAGDDGDEGAGDDELQFALDVTLAAAAAPPQQQRRQEAEGAAAALSAELGDGDAANSESDEDGCRGQGLGHDLRRRSSSSSDDEEEEVAAMSPLSSSALPGAFATGLVLSPLGGGSSCAATAAAAAPPGGAMAAGPAAGGRARRINQGSDSASAAATPLYGSSPISGCLMATSYGAARAGGAANPWLYGTSPGGTAGGTAAAVLGTSASGTKSWLYGTSPVMGASPFFRTGGAASISHNGWLARAAAAATKKDSGRGLMSLNLSGCRAISSDGVKALLAAPLTKSCLLQLDISRCPRITRAALVLPATSNLCVLRASGCHNLHEVIMQLPLSSPLTELHLADCKALTKLHVVAPALQQLHVGSCRHLTRLYLRCPQLRHLTASLSFGLVNLDPERWEVGRLAHLNLFGCRHLEWPGLAALLGRCGPSLRHLDINGCNAITVAEIPAGADALRHLDASGCKSLVALRCPSPALAAAALRSCPRLQELVLDSAVLTRLDISNCPHLAHLTMPALHRVAAALQEQGQHVQQAAPAAAGAPAGHMGALRAAMSGGGAATDEAQVAAGGSGSSRGVMIRMAGCDRLPVETAVLLRRLRERAKQQAAAEAAAAAGAETATPAAGRTGALMGRGRGL